MVSLGFYINFVNFQLVNGNNLSLEDVVVKFNFFNIGFVISLRVGRGMEIFNFVIGLNCLVDFYEEFFYQGILKGSIVQCFEEVVNVNGFDDFEVGVVFDVEVLILDNGFYFSDFFDFLDVEVECQEVVV